MSILESGLDFAPIDERSNPNLMDSTPIIVVQHGLTGGESLTEFEKRV